MRGKGLNRATRPTTCTDHPRLCGEKFILAVNVTLYSGITPAYAGKSADRQVVIVRQWDHPRLCGEKL